MKAATLGYETLLVFQNGISDKVLNHLRTIFKTVHHYPVSGWSIKPGDILPTDQHYEEADVLLTFVIPPNLRNISQTPRLKFWQAMTSGSNHLVTTDFYKSIPADNPLMLASASGIHGVCIGEHVLASILVLFHTLNTLIIIAKNEQKWINVYNEYDGMYIRVMRGSTVGIVGYGHIGAECARMCHSLGAKIIALTRKGIPVKSTGFQIEGTGDVNGELPEAFYSSSSESDRKAFFNRADVVVNTLPSQEGTVNFIGEEELKQMKGNALLVNIGRGDTIEQEFMITALQAKVEEGEDVSATGTLRIGGASLDVTTPEPLPTGHILFTLPNVIITPHMSSLSVNYYETVSDLLTQQIVRIRNDQGVLNSIRGRGEFE